MCYHYHGPEFRKYTAVINIYWNGGKRYDYSGGNPWGGFSLDKARGIAYVTTGNAGRYFNGVNRPGKNKYANANSS